MSKFKMTPRQVLDMATARTRQETLDKFKYFAVTKSINAENLGTYQKCEFCRASRAKDFRDGQWQPWKFEIEHKPGCLYAEIIEFLCQ